MPAVKYKRNPSAIGPSELSSDSWRPGCQEPKQRLIVIYLGLAGASVILLLAQPAIEDLGGASRGEHHGVAVVESKGEVEGDGARKDWLSLRFQTESGTEVATQATVERAVWERMRAGDRLGIVYRQDWRGRRVEVVATGLFALP